MTCVRVLRRHGCEDFPRNRSFRDRWSPKEVAMTIAVTHRRPSVVLAITFCVVLLVSVSAGFAESFDRMVIFGDSVSDPRNHFVAFWMMSPARCDLLSGCPYDIGSNCLTI